MATSSTTVTASADLYNIYTFVEAIKAKFIDVPEDTLAMGIYGYLSEMHSQIIENAAIMGAEYSNEAIPTKAQFERNVIAHALSLGIEKIRAVPASMDVMICIPEVNLLANMTDDSFTLDKEFAIMLGEYEYHFDFDIVIERNLLPNGDHVYTAIYDMDDNNEITDITNPYLPTIGNTTMSNTNLIMINTTIRQVTHSTVYKKIIVNNPLENKIINFTFEDQLAYFYVEVVEDDTTTYLKCVYDGLYDYENTFCNYMYIDASTIRIKFNRDSYQPRSNADVTIHIYTTKGSECNFSYTTLTPQDLTSDRFSYDNIFIVTEPITDSANGADKQTIDELKKNIPKEALSRGVVTTYTDIDNYFNSINTDDCRLYFLEKVHNQLERMYYSYLLLKADNNVIPTNTLDILMSRSMYKTITGYNYIMNAGGMFYYDAEKTCTGIPLATDTEKATYDSSGFFYINPFLTVVNKNPFFVSYYLNILDYTRNLTFDYINKTSQLQFISKKISCQRLYFTDRDTYKVSIEMTQNINSDYSLINTDDDSNITDCFIKVFGVFYINDVPYRYVPGSITDYDSGNFIYDFQMEFKTGDIIDKNGRITIESGLYDINTTHQLTGYLPASVDFKIFILAKFDDEYGREQDVDSIIPGLDGYTLCNVYSLLNSTLDLYYDYTNIVTSYITLKKNDDGSYDHNIKKMPLVRYTYLNTEARMKAFLKEVEYRRIWINACLLLLQDSFDIDFKFFNTYGPSKLYNVNNTTLLDRVNMSLKFELKFTMAQYATITSDISLDVKDYLEDINDISDLHIPNLTTYITNKYRTQLVYFKFIGLNNYDALKQSIYREDIDEFVESNTVPEFLNVNTLSDDNPDIKYLIGS